MNYAEVRNQIRSGDLLVWSHRGIKSWHDLKIWFVRLFTRSEYSHVGLAWVVGGRVFVIEAVQPVVRNYPLSKLLADGAYWITTGAAWRPETEELALSCVGDPYSQVQAVQAPFGKPPEDKLWQCAELVATVLRADGIELGTVYTPSAIARSAMARPRATSTLLEQS
jgi:hypothetical protein